MIRRRTDGQQGFTVAELITVCAIIAILAAVALPVAKFGFRRQKEIELRERLRRITEAIDRYHDLRLAGRIKELEKLGQAGYPKDLEELVNGVDLTDGTKMRFLRDRDLLDPMTGEKEWDTLSSTDAPDSSSSDDNNVFEVRSRSRALSLDGKTHYNEW